MRLLACLGPVTLSIALALSGCGDDDAPPVPMRDAQVPLDARAPVDAEAPLDAQRLPDGEVPDGASDGGPATAECTSDELELASLSEISLERVALAAGPSGFLVAWIARRGGFLEPHWALAPSEGAAPEPQFLELRARAGAVAAIRQGGGYLLGFHANPASDNELYALALSDAGAATGAPARWTTHAGADDRISLLASDGGTIATWTQAEPGAASRIALSGWFDAAATPQGTPQTLASGDDVPLEITLANAGTGALAGWVRARDGAADVVVRPLGARGAPTAAALPVSTEGNALGAVDIAGDEDGAVVVFGAVAGGGLAQVRVRRVNAEGAATGSERFVANGSDPAVVRYGGAYAVALRERSGTSASLVLLFLDAQLSVVGRVELGAAATEGSLRMGLSSDGRLGIARAEVDTVASRTRVLLTRVDCAE